MGESVTKNEAARCVMVDGAAWEHEFALFLFFILFV